MASERITIILPGDLAAKLRKKQADKIKKTNGTVSFSNILEETLRKCI